MEEGTRSPQGKEKEEDPDPKGAAKGRTSEE